MATREVLSPAKRASLFKLPENLSERELARHYTLSEVDLNFIARHRGSQNRLGLAVQLCLLRFPGRGLIATDPVPQSVIAYLAKQVHAQSSDFSLYLKGREATHSNHFREIKKQYGFRLFNEEETIKKNLASWLLPYTMGINHALSLVSLILTEMRARKIVIPGASVVEAFVWEVISPFVARQ